MSILWEGKKMLKAGLEIVAWSIVFTLLFSKIGSCPRVWLILYIAAVLGYAQIKEVRL